MTEPFAVAPMPSICPEASRFGSPPVARRKAANLSDDEPALSVRTIGSKCVTPLSWRPSAPPKRAGLAAPVFVELRERTGDEPSSIVIGPARQHHRCFGPKHQSRRFRPRDEGEFLYKDISGFQIGKDQHISMAGDQRGDALGASGLDIHRVVHRERPVHHRAADLAALGHLRQYRRVHGRGGQSADPGFR